MEKQSIRLRILKCALLISFMFCYLEWGQNNSGFIFQLEAGVFKKENFTSGLFHPFILIPFAGQVLLLVSIIRRPSARRLTLTSITFLGLLVLMILLVGILAKNFKIMVSVIPFIMFSIYYLRTYRR